MDKRSRSTSASRQQHDPYHAVSEVYTKEVTHRPIGPASEYPPEILDILREEPRAPHSPPLVRSRENTWTPENFPIVRVPSAQFTDIMMELYDYHHEVEKYSRRSVTPEPLHRQQEIVERAPPPTYQVIPPTPEKNAPGGIPLADPPKKPLPMYEEYVKMQNQENRMPVPRPQSRSDSRNNNLRHIDSSSSSESFLETESVVRRRDEPDVAPFTKSEDIGKRYVYSHDVYVDSSTGRPFTPGREDLREKKNCDKLKINVYFKPPHPPVEETYKLDEIEIEKQEQIRLPKLRPSPNPISTRPPSSNPSLSTPPQPSSSPPHSTEMEQHRRIPIRTSVLRKEHEILTVPLNRAHSVRQSRISEQSTRRSASRTITERSIPIHMAAAAVEEAKSIDMDEIFPKMPHVVTNVPGYPASRSSSHVAGSIDKGDHPRHQRIVIPSSHHSSQRALHPDSELHLTRGTPSDKDYRAKDDYRVKRTPSEVRIPVTVAKPPPKRLSPEELDYGKFQKVSEGKQTDLPYTRGLSKTPSGETLQKYSNPAKGVHIPYNSAEKERAYQQHQPKSLPSARSSYRSHGTNKIATEKSETPELPFTRGISKTPSDKDQDVHIPYNNPEKERAYQQANAPKRVPSGRHSPSKRTRSPGKPRPHPGANPFEEIVHIKERYERDETIRRFFPTTTTV